MAATQVSINGWMNAMESYSGMRKGNPTMRDNMDGPEDTVLSEISQAEKDK